MQKKPKALSLLILSAFLLFTFTGCASQTVSGTNIVKIKTASADKHKLEAILRVQGVLIPAKTSNVLSKISGQITSINAEVGKRVKAGDILVRIETKTIEAQLEQAQAGLQSAKASLQSVENQAAIAKINLDTVQKSYNDIKVLYEAGAASGTQMDDITSKLDTAKRQYENAAGAQKNQAQAAVNTAKANINSIKVQLDNTVIKSPINGIIVNKNVNAEEIAAVGSPLLVIADTSTLKLKGTVSQEFIPFIKQGQDINISIDIYPDKQYKGKIENIGPISVSTGMIFPIEISIENKENINAGLSASALISIADDKGVVIPSAAVIQNNGESHVFVIKDNIASKRIVTAGLKNDKEVEILKGLNEGEKVAVTNVNSIFDNMHISIE